MKLAPLILALLILSPLVRTQESATTVAATALRRDQIDAATANAVESLRLQIEQQEVSPGLLVRDVLDKTGARDTLLRELTKAQKIGGPRWLDAQTCQVRLEVPASRIAQTFRQVATANPKTSPVTADYLTVHLRDWEGRSFSATGTSTAALAQAVPLAAPNDPNWAAVPDAARKQAVAAARQDAANRALTAIRTITLTPGKTVGDTLTNPTVRQSLEQWLTTRPVTRVEFARDLEARVTLSVAGDELFDAFRSAVPDAVPKDEAALTKLRNQFIDRVSTVTGRGTATAAAANPAPAVQIPTTPPDWVKGQLYAQGSAKPKAKENRLKCARAAETDARTRLRAQVDPLPLTETMTLGQAATRDPRIADAITRGIAQAKPYKVDYMADGSAAVKMILNVQDVWDEIRDTADSP